MSTQKAYWEEIFSLYKTSGLSQPEFYKQNNLSTNQFQYPWYERNKALKANEVPSPFDSISIIPTPINSVMASYPFIYLIKYVVMYD